MAHNMHQCIDDATHISTHTLTDRVQVMHQSMQDAAHTHTHTDTHSHMLQRDMLAYSEELLLASPLVHPGGRPCNVIQVVGTRVHIRLADAVTVLAFIGCCKPAAIIHTSRQ